MILLCVLIYEVILLLMRADDDVDEGGEIDDDRRIININNLCKNMTIYISMQSKIININPN